MTEVSRTQEATGWERVYQEHAIGEASPAYLWDQRPHPFIEEIDLIRQLRLRRTGLIVDAGCGDGRNTICLAQAGFSAVGLDISDSAISLARARVLREGYNNIIFIRDDICSLHTAGPVDAILCADALGQVNSPELALAEFYRILRPGGVLVANVYDQNDDTYGEGEPHPSLPRSFNYKGTLFRYFDRPAYEGMFNTGWTNVTIRQSIWFDGPHHDFRPMPHMHSSLVAWAEKPGEENYA